MKLPYLTATFAGALLLSACGPKAERDATAANQPAAVNVAGGDMGNMAMPADAKMAKSTGIVTAIDKKAGKITLDHQAIAEVNWPAMTMTFNAKPGVLDGLAVGDKVAFDVTIKGNAGEVTAATKQ
jgi:Cu/Ag efflux protein CusF